MATLLRWIIKIHTINASKNRELPETDEHFIYFKRLLSYDEQQAHNILRVFNIFIFPPALNSDVIIRVHSSLVEIRMTSFTKLEVVASNHAFMTNYDRTKVIIVNGTVQKCRNTVLIFHNKLFLHNLHFY